MLFSLNERGLAYDHCFSDDNCVIVKIIEIRKGLRSVYFWILTSMMGLKVAVTILTCSVYICIWDIDVYKCHTDALIDKVFSPWSHNKAFSIAIGNHYVKFI